MDVEELRTAFTNSDDIATRVSQYRSDRVWAIFNYNTPVGVQNGCKIIFHIIPRSGFSNGASLDLATHQNELQQFHPLGRNGYQNSLISMDGITTYANLTDGRTHAYTHIDRRGFVEAVAVFSGGDDGEKHLHSKRFEEYLLAATPRYLGLLAAMGLEPPYYLLLSFAELVDYSFLVPQDNGFGFTLHQSPQNILNFPELYLTEPTTPADTMLRPLFDVVWNAFGFIRSENYSATGERKK
jgi:hypothetical protein